MPTVAWQRRALPWPEITFVIKMGSMITAMSPLAFLGGLLMPASSYIGRSGIVDKKGNIVAVTSAQTFLGGLLISASSYYGRSGIVDKKGNIVAVTSAQTFLGGLLIPASSYYGRSGIVDKKGNIVAVTNRPGVCGVGPGPRGCKSTRDDRSPTFGPSVSTGTDPHRPGRPAL